MSIGVGTDIADVARFERLLEDVGFTERVFTPDELRYINGRAATAAGIFCAKEAFVKALGLGVFSAMHGRVEVGHLESGRPYLILQGELAERYAGYEFDLSIAHTDTVATATVVWRTK